MNLTNQFKNKLQFHEARFEAIAQTASDSIVISDENSIIVFANKKTYEVFGYADGSLIGSDLGVLMPEKYRQGHRNGVKRFIATGSPKLIGHTIEIEGLCKDGSIFPLELSLSSWKEEESYFFSGIIRDITERKNAFREKEEANKNLLIQQKKLESANKELLETKHLLQEITDAVPNLIYVNDLTTKRNIFINKEITALTGYTPAEIQSLDLTTTREKIIHPDDLPLINVLNEDYKSLEKGEASEVHFRIKHKDGRWRWLRTISKVFKVDANGTPLQVLGITEDVTAAFEAHNTIKQQNEELATALEELQSAEEELRATANELEVRVEKRTKELAESNITIKQKEEQIHLIIDAMPVLIAYLRKDRTYEFVNKAYENLHKRKIEDIIGKPMWEVIGDEAYDNKLPLLERAFRGEYVESQILQDYDGLGKKWVKISVVPHKVKEKVVGIFSLVEDITEFKNVQLQLEGKNNELEKVNNDLDNFVYTASHDLKSPISNLEGIIKLLNKSVPDQVGQKERKMLEMMDVTIQKLRKTIEDLTEIIKTQKELEDSLDEPVGFGEISREVKEDIYSLIQESNPLIKEEYQLKEITYKKGGLRSVMYNLLSNAIKYRDPDRPLEVALKTFIQDGFAVLSVKDNGLGINENQQKKLFKLFNRIHKHIDGTGIGLFMIKRIVENNGGRIEIISEEGKGTEFLVFLTKIKKSLLP